MSRRPAAANRGLNPAANGGFRPASSLFRFYFFDWDGCLAHTLPFWLSGYREALARRGLHPSDEVIVRELFSDWSGPARFGVQDPGRFVEEMAAYLAEHAREVELNPHILKVLTRLKELGRGTALLTACRRDIVLPTLARRGVGPLLDLVLALEDVARPKPDPEVVLLALQRLGAETREALFVGDSDKDIMAARAAGVEMALYLPDRNRRYYSDELVRSWNPGRVIRDFRELLPDEPKDPARPGEG
jgi:HAD superfamily hydrolase (TIGR01509 family)